MRVAVIILIFSGLLIGCETDTQRYQRERAELRRQIEAIPEGQPVSQVNADILASAYWRHYCSRCGAVYPVRDGGQYWSAHVVAGFIPVDKLDILIEKESGQISSSGRPTVINWSELWK
jgi:hypothetical protein